MVRLEGNLTRPSSAIAARLITYFTLGSSRWHAPAQHPVSNGFQGVDDPRSPVLD